MGIGAMRRDVSGKYYILVVGGPVLCSAEVRYGGYR